MFGRPGPAITAQSGDYTAAQVTNAVSTAGSYADPGWITGLAYSKLTGVPSSFTPSAHTHTAAETTSGVFTAARLGSGTPSAGNYLRGDGAWTVITAAQVSGAVPDTRQVIAGTGLTGGGALSANVTLNANIAAIQTPWTQAISGGGFALTSVASIESPLYRSTPDMVFGVGSGYPERVRISASLGHVRFTGNIEISVNQAFGANLYSDGTNFRYIGAGSGLAFSVVSGASTFYTAVSGTAGAVATLGAALTFRDDGTSEIFRKLTVSSSSGVQLTVAPANGVSGNLDFALDKITRHQIAAEYSSKDLTFNRYNSSGVYQTTPFRILSNVDAAKFDSACFFNLPANVSMDTQLPNGSAYFAWGSNTAFIVRVKGSDGVVRAAAITLA